MKTKKLLIVWGILCLCMIYAWPLQAAETMFPILPGSPLPDRKTVIKLESSYASLDLAEDSTMVNCSLSLVNPTNKKVRLAMKMPADSLLKEDEFAFYVTQNGQQVETTYDDKRGLYYWEIVIEAEEEILLTAVYTCTNQINENGLTVTGFEFSSPEYWSGEFVKNTLSVHLKDFNPGLIKSIEPQDYLLRGSSLVWSWNQVSEAKRVVITSDIKNEKDSWKNPFTPEEKKRLDSTLEHKYYLAAAFFFTNKYEEASHDDKILLRTGQAYYLEKAGKHKEALAFWEELSEDKAPSPYIYWALGKEYKALPGKLAGLYNQVKDLQVHPLLQQWLANQLAPAKVKLAAPEIHDISTSVEENRPGLHVNAAVSDADGDIDTIILKYHWEDAPPKEVTFELQPFQYTHHVSCFLPAEKPMQRLYYELVASDSKNNTASTDPLENFYLNSQIQSFTYPLYGAKLVLGDFSPEESDKVYKWFKGYLEKARKAKFIPLGGKSPYFIFLGEPHRFINEYSGPLFLLYTPPPFSPAATINSVHRYFLSFWYGPGWYNLSPDKLKVLGDGLLLGQGSYAKKLKYLQHEDSELFYRLLEQVGEGREWEQALKDTYHLSAAELTARSYWYAYGNNVLAVIIILLFAWLGKTGLLVKLIRFIR